MTSFSLANTAFASLANVLASRLRLTRSRTGCLDQLSNDVLIDHVSVYLNVEDIMALRRVSKLYYYLTHHPIIWKRFLRLMNIPLPPLPPTGRYLFGTLTCIEAERLVIRTITLDDNWRSPKPVIFRVESLRPNAEVLSMTVLPGGKYLVASLRDPGHHRYSVMVYILDRPTGNAVPLAKTSTGTKAYNLQAKYLTIQGEQGIAIAFIRRHFKGGAQTCNGFDISEYGIDTEIDPPASLRHECICLHISLSALEILGECRYQPGSVEFYQYATAQPPPFNVISQIRTKSTLGKVSLDEISGVPFLSVVKHPESIVMKDLNRGLKSTLHCRRFYQLHVENVICNFCVIPVQNQILVIRKVSLPRGVEEYSIEMFNIPAPGTEVWWHAQDQVRTEEWNNSKEKISSFWISDPSVSYYDRLEMAAIPQLPPISVFGRIVPLKSGGPNKHDLIHYVMWPRPLGTPTSQSTTSHSTRVKHYYSLDTMIYQNHYTYETDAPQVIPGPYRSLIYTFPKGDQTIFPPLVSMFSYVTPGLHEHDGEGTFMKDVSQLQIITKGRKCCRSDPYANITLPPHIKEMAGKGVMAIAWDEAIGRVCISTVGDDTIHILDFAQTPKLDDTGQRLPLPLVGEQLIMANSS